MKVWKQFDKDCSGYIEADELKQFIKTLLNAHRGAEVTEEKLIEYTDTIVCRQLIYIDALFFFLNIYETILIFKRIFFSSLLILF